MPAPGGQVASSGLRSVAARKDGRGLRWPSKDPAERLDYVIDWTACLDGDAIASSTFTLPAGIMAESSSCSATAAVVWLSSGADRRSYLVVNRITTASGRVMRQAVRIKVKAKSRA